MSKGLVKYREELLRVMNVFLPHATIDEDLDGQLIIYTGLREGPKEMDYQLEEIDDGVA